MEDDDIVDQQSVALVRSITQRTARRTVVLSLLAGMAGAFLGAALTYALYGPERLAATWFLLTVFPAMGAYQAVHWWRHYRSILRQLEVIEAKVAQGEVVHGSQVKFHSYR